MTRIGRLGAPYLDVILFEVHGTLGSVDIRLARESDCGFIALRQGELVHASTARRIGRDDALDDATGAAAVYDMLAWSSGSFAVMETNVAVGTTVFTALNDLVLEGLRRLTDSTEIRRRLPPAEMVLEIVRTPRGVIDTPLTAVELTMLSEIDGRRTLVETIERSVLGVALSRHTLLRMIAIGLASVRSGDPHKHSASDLCWRFPFESVLRRRRSRRLGSNVL